MDKRRETDDFPQSVLDEIKNKINLAELIGESVELKKVGPNMKGNCPFKPENTPSFVVYNDHYHCFGCCAHGTAFKWLTEQEGMTFPEAVRALAVRAQVNLPEPKASAGDAPRPPIQRERMQSLAVLSQAARHYRQALQRNDRAMAYLTLERELTHETIQKWGLGVVGPGIAGLLMRDTTREAIATAGITRLNEDPGKLDHEYMRDRIMVPIRAGDGTVIGFAGRVYASERFSGSAKYLNSPETPVFHKTDQLFGWDQARAAISKTRSAVVVEGYFDVISLHQAGEGRALATMGTALTPSQLRSLTARATDIVFAFDGDAAGVRAAYAAMKQAVGVITDQTRISVIFLEEKDPDALIRERGIDAWQAALKLAVPMSGMILRDVMPETLPTPEDVASAVLKGKEWLEAITHAPIFQTAMAGTIAQRLGVPVDMILPPAAEPSRPNSTMVP